MRFGSSATFVLLGCAVLLATATSARADISIGTSFGVAIHSPEVGDNSTLIGVPSQAGLTGTLRPGLRIGGVGNARDHEFYLDTSYDGITSGGSGVHALRFGLNYQYNFKRGAGTHPYVTAGGGMYNVGGPSISATSPTFGGGIGLGVPVSEDHGRFRVEFRVDHLGRGKDNGNIVVDSANVYQLMAGFDLWMKN